GQDTRTQRERIEDLTIPNRETGTLQKFISNETQVILWDTITDLQERGLPVWIMGAKARQVGWSTSAEALIYDSVKMNPNTRAITVGHKMKSADNMFRMFNRFYANDEQRLPKVISSRKELQFAQPYNSLITIESSKDVAAGVSGTYQFAHFTEMSLWDDPETTMSAFLPSIPYIPGSIFILETVVYEGVKSVWWEEFWNRTKEGETRFTPIFIPWYILSDYEIPLLDGEDLYPYSEYEEWGQKELGWTDEKIKWRRLQIRDYVKEGKSEVNFLRMYPSTEEEMFRSSAGSFFDFMVLGDLRKEAETRKFAIGSLVSDASDPFCREMPSFVPEAKDITEGRWLIYQYPQPYDQYVLGVDTATSYDDSDYSSIDILSAHTLNQVATFHGLVGPLELGPEAIKGGRYYNLALAGIETNGVGQSTFDTMKGMGYENLYYRKGKQQKIGTSYPKDGFYMTDTLKGSVVHELKKNVEAEIVTVFSEAHFREMGRFVKTENGKYEALQGANDDRVISLAIAVQMVSFIEPIIHRFQTVTQDAFDMEDDDDDFVVNRKKRERRMRQETITGY
ncbi:MAG: hypothetical protein KKB31_07395, partial [Nanoarchaeota archaeon]|nr:hypothetical protein [Nanoarchaeota archaeon]